MVFFRKPTSRRNFLIKAAVEEKEDSSPNQLQEPANICQHLPTSANICQHLPTSANICRCLWILWILWILWAANSSRCDLSQISLPGDEREEQLDANSSDDTLNILPAARAFSMDL